MRILVFPLIGIALLTACGSRRTAELEKENEELRKQLLIADLSLQEKCSQAAKNYVADYSRNREKDDWINFSNHYNKTVNGCFVVINSARTLPNRPGDGRTRYYGLVVANVYEGNYNLIGRFEECEVIDTYPIDNKISVKECVFDKTPCHSRDEFQAQLKSVMNK